MDYSKIQNGMESIIEALKENNSTSNGVDYNGISDMLHGQNDILKNWFQNTFSADMRDGMKKAIEASTGQGQAEATTDLVGTINSLRDLIGATFESEEISSENIANHIDASEIADNLVIDVDASDIASYIDIDSHDVGQNIEIDTSHLAQCISEDLGILFESKVNNPSADTNSAAAVILVDKLGVDIDKLGVDLFKRMDEIDEKAISWRTLSETIAEFKFIPNLIASSIDKLGVDLFQRMDNVGETIDAQFQNTGERLTELGNSMDTLFSHTDTGQESAKQEVISAVYDQLGNLQREILTESQLKEYVSQTRQETESQYHETHRMLTVCLERLNSIEDTQIATDQKALEEKLESIEPDEGISTKKAILNLESRIKLLESWVCSLSEDCDNYKRRIDLLVEKA